MATQTYKNRKVRPVVPFANPSYTGLKLRVGLPYGTKEEIIKEVSALLSEQIDRTPIGEHFEVSVDIAKYSNRKLVVLNQSSNWRYAEEEPMD